MKRYSCTLGRHLRLAFLLLLLSSQGFANAHEQSSSHSIDSHFCSICLIGHALDSALDAYPNVLQVQVPHSLISIHSNVDQLLTHCQYYYTRAPPNSLCNTQNPS